jgi:hypothetical protein
VKHLASSSKVRVGEPGDQPYLPGTISIHIIFGAATCSGSVPLDDVPSAVADASRQFGGRDLAKARQGVRTGIVELMKNNAHMTAPGANGITCAALWLTWTAPDKTVSDYFRVALKDESRLVLLLTEHSIYGRRAINGRTLWFRPDAPWQEMVAAVGTGLSTDEMARRLAPH